MKKIIVQGIEYLDPRRVPASRASLYNTRGGIMKTRTKLSALLAFLLIIPVFAAAPTALSVLMGGVPLDGKALWYDGKIYVPVESVAKALDGKYSYDKKSGVAAIDLGGRNRKSKGTLNRAYLKTVKERVYSTGDNLKILATVVNTGNSAARDIEITCTFESSYLGEISAGIANLPELKPGQRKTVEFWLYEQRIPDATGGRPYSQPMTVPAHYLARDSSYVYIGTNWQRVTHDLDFNFLNSDDTYQEQRSR